MLTTHILWFQPLTYVRVRRTLSNVSRSGRRKNLKINRSKSLEIIFTGSRRRRTNCSPHPLPITDIRRATSMKILGVTVTNHLSVSEHLRDATCSCVQSMHAIRILRHHGLSTESLQIIFKVVVVAKLTYASPAWWGFTTADDRNRMEGLLRRGRRAELYNGPTLSQTIEDADDRLFSSIMYNEHHLLHRLLPEHHHTNYSLKITAP